MTIDGLNREATDLLILLVILFPSLITKSITTLEEIELFEQLRYQPRALCA